MTTTEVVPPSAPPPVDGALDAWLTKVLGRNWRTSLVGLVSLACSVAPFVPFLPPGVKEAARALAPIVTGGGFLLAKDARVSGPMKN